jgi:hypothetical protein
VPEIHVISSPQIKNGRKAHSNTPAKKGFDFSKLSLDLKVLAERLKPPDVVDGDPVASLRAGLRTRKSRSPPLSSLLEKRAWRNGR